MQLCDTIPIDVGGAVREVQLLIGDLAHLEEGDAVDLLVVSAFPDNYWPTETSLIGALDRVGVSLADLAGDKAVDLRQFSACWLSQPIQRPELGFSRILCFEPRVKGKAPEVVGDLFRSLVPFTAGDPPVRRIAMPLLAAGDQMESPMVMLEALADASAYWLASGLSLDCIKVVLARKWAGSSEPLEVFAKVKAQHTNRAAPAPEHAFDAFISYSHQDMDAVDGLVDDLQSHRPDLRLFVDRIELKPGFAWQRHIFESLDRSRKVICVLSPAYVESKVCQDEFNMALIRHRRTDAGVLLPVYLRSAHLPTYMEIMQYVDAREADPQKIAQSAEMLTKVL
jgi:hypothetical protein